MLIYWAAMVHATSTHTIYNLYNFDEYVPKNVCHFPNVERERSSIKCDGVVRDTEFCL